MSHHLAPAVVLVTLVALASPAAAQVTVPEPPPTDPPPTAPTPEPTSPPDTEPTPATEPPATAPPTTRAQTATTARGRTTSTTATTAPRPTTTLFTIPGQAGTAPAATSTTFAPFEQDDQLPRWSTNLFWIGVAGALAIMVTTFVMSGRDT